MPTNKCLTDASRVPIPSPQLIDPQLDYMTFLLLRRLQSGPFLQMGLKMARTLLGDRTKPTLLVVCTDAFGEVMADALDALRQLATSAGVPVVHALSRRDLGQACGAKHCLSVAAVMGTPDRGAAELLSMVMVRAAAAYGGYLTLVAAAEPAPAPQTVSFTELPPDTFHLSSRLLSSLAALSM